eukprot:3860588-Lingulodinium_polyedra.AAC.1
MICDDPSGFLKFEWPDGMTWISEQPQLMYDEDPTVLSADDEAEDVVIKKPPKENVMKKPSTDNVVKKDTWKIAHSRCYHEAARQFDKLRKNNDEKVANVAKKEFIGRATAKLKQEWMKKGWM